jgi:hypothetical protein
MLATAAGATGTAASLLRYCDEWSVVVPSTGDLHNAAVELIGSVDATFLRWDRALLCNLLALSLYKSTAFVRAASAADALDHYPLLTGWLKRRWRTQERAHAEALRRCLQQIWPHVDVQRVAAPYVSSVERACADKRAPSDDSAALEALIVERLARAAHCRMLTNMVGDSPLATVFESIGFDELSAARVLEQYARAVGCESARVRWTSRFDLVRTLFARDGLYRQAFDYSVTFVQRRDARREQEIRKRSREAFLAHHPFHELADEVAKRAQLPAYLVACGAAVIRWGLRLRQLA